MTISEIYGRNDSIRQTLLDTLEALPEEKLNARPDDGTWTIQECVEHIATVDDGIQRICARLLEQAQANGVDSGGAVQITAEFSEKTSAAQNTKFEAPDRVKPTGTQSITDSFAKMVATRAKFEELKPLFESVEARDAKFPHPAFGDMNAHEWLVLVGGHDSRHIKQIKEILAKLG